MDAKNKNMHFKCEVVLALQHFLGWHHNHIQSEL